VDYVKFLLLGTTVLLVAHFVVIVRNSFNQRR
jgi:hypothetical protein